MRPRFRLLPIVGAILLLVLTGCAAPATVSEPTPASDTQPTALGVVLLAALCPAYRADVAFNEVPSHCAT